jgi:hypothetical protein
MEEGGGGVALLAPASAAGEPTAAEHRLTIDSRGMSMVTKPSSLCVAARRPSGCVVAGVPAEQYRRRVLC